MAHHRLKITKEFMKAKVAGDKPFEIRFNDRGYQKGDSVTYITDKTPACEYEGTYLITYVTGFAQKDNFVVFGDQLVCEEHKNEVLNDI